MCGIDARECSNTFNSDFIGESSDSSSETVKIALCGSPTDCQCQCHRARLSEFHSVSDDHCDDDVIV